MYILYLLKLLVQKHCSLCAGRKYFNYINRTAATCSVFVFDQCVIIQQHVTNSEYKLYPWKNVVYSPRKQMVNLFEK